MGLRDLVLFYIVTGISLRWIATAATAGPSAITVWLIAWAAFYLPLALSVVELSARYPQEGGLYVWSKRAFGDFAGFMTGWIYWVSNLPYFPAVLYFTAGNALFIGGSYWQHLSNSKSYFVIFSLVALGLATVLNVVGLQVGKWLHNVGAIGTWLPIVLLFAMAGLAYAKFGSATSFAPANMAPSARIQDMVFWTTLVFALGGAESASCLGDEVENARRNLPRGLLIAGLVVTSGYILGTVAVLIVLPHGEVSGLQGIMQAIAKGGERLGFPGITPVAALLITLSNLGAVGAWLAATARLPFVAGIDRFLPAAFGRLHPKWGTPAVALLTQAGLGMAFVFLGQAGTSVKGAYDALVNIGIVAYLVPYLFTFAAMIKLQSEPAEPDVFRVPGGTPGAIVLATIGFITTSITIALSLLPPPDEPNQALAVLKIVGLTSILLGAGVVVFGIGRLRIKLRRAEAAR
jgi:amino acid transporter